jgi:hypothetical protein
MRTLSNFQVKIIFKIKPIEIKQNWNIFAEFEFLILLWIWRIPSVKLCRLKKSNHLFPTYHLNSKFYRKIYFNVYIIHSENHEQRSMCLEFSLHNTNLNSQNYFSKIYYSNYWNQFIFILHLKIQLIHKIFRELVDFKQN